MSSLTLYQFAQVVLTACAVVLGFLLLRRCARRPSQTIVVEEAVCVAQPVRVKLTTRSFPALSSMRKDELIAECKARNQPVDGTNKVLRSRLRLERSRDAHDEVSNRLSCPQRPSRAQNSTASASSSR